LRWNRILAAFFLIVWIAMMPFILFPDLEQIGQINALIISILSFPLFAFYAARYDEKSVIPFNYLPNAYSLARRSLKLDGGVLFIGRLFVIGFMALLIWAAILLGFLNAGGIANDVAIYAYYSLVLGVALIALSSWGRRELPLEGKKVERSLLDLKLSSTFHILKTWLSASKVMLISHMSLATKELRAFRVSRNQRTESVHVDEITMSEVLAERNELLRSIEELRSRLDVIQQINDQKLEEIRKLLARIEEKLGHQTD
jgi:hypothetical protein